jgi:hypothetical protein
LDNLKSQIDSNLNLSFKTIKTLSDDDNMDNIIDTGAYPILNQRPLNNPRNLHKGDQDAIYGTLIVYSNYYGSSNITSQILYDGAIGATAIRHKNFWGNWTSWQWLATGDEIASINGQIKQLESSLNQKANQTNLSNLSNASFKIVRNLSDDDDLDNIVDNGIYPVINTRPENNPRGLHKGDSDSIYGFLINLNIDNVKSQILIDSDYKTTYIRYSVFWTSWTNWQTMATK